MLVTGLVGKLFDNLKSYPVHNQIHGLVPIELYALVLFGVTRRCRPGGANIQICGSLTRETGPVRNNLNQKCFFGNIELLNIKLSLNEKCPVVAA